MSSSIKAGKRDTRRRLMCGGGHHSKKKYLSSGSFTNEYPGCRYETTGFRLARLRSPLERLTDTLEVNIGKKDEEV